MGDAVHTVRFLATKCCPYVNCGPASQAGERGHLINKYDLDKQPCTDVMAYM